MPKSFKNLIKILTITVLFCSALPILPTKVEAATDGNFSISVPNGGALIEGCTYSADIRVNSGTNVSNAADVIVNYDPTKIDIVDSNTTAAGTQIKPGVAYEVYPLAGNQVNETLGIIRLAGVSLSNYFSGNDVFATIQFKGIPGQTTGAFNIQFDGVGQTLDSNIADQVTSTDVLGSVTNASVSFLPGSCIPDTTPPNVNFQSPTNNQSGVPVNQSITMTITDALSGVNLSTLVIIVNGVVYTASSPQITITGNPSNYSILLDPTDPFYTGSPSNIVVRVQDYAANERQSSISFNYPTPISTPTPTPTATVVPTLTETPTPTPTLPSDLQGPTIEFVNPISSETIGGNEDLVVIIRDVGTGINLNNLIIYVNDQRFTISDFRIIATGNPNEYRITIKGPFTYPTNSSSYFAVSVTDFAGNAASSNIPFNIPQPINPGDKNVCENPTPDAPLGSQVQDAQNALEEAAPDALKPIVQDTGIFGFASLIALLPLLAQLGYVLISFLAGGFLWPLISALLIPGNRKVGSVIDDITRQGIALVKITVIEKNTGSTVRQTVTDFAGKYYLHLDPGIYIFRLDHANYIAAETEATFNESKDIDFIFQLSEKESADLGTQAQFAVFKLDPKLMLIYFALFLSVLNLIYIRSAFSIILFIIFFIVAATMTLRLRINLKRKSETV